MNQQHKGLNQRQIIALERAKYLAECNRTTEILYDCSEYHKLWLEDRREQKRKHRKEDLK